MGEPRLRAVVLAAGHGMRLRPLTDVLPKPLLPVLGRPVVDHTLAALAAAGCEAAALNLHHLGDQIRETFGGAYRGMRLVYSRESQLLGTLGAMGPLASFVAKADELLVVNGDSLCRWPLTLLLRRHRGSEADATLMLTTRADPDRFGGGVVVDRDDAIRSLRGRPAGERERRRVFAGAHVFAPRLLRRSTVPLGDQPADFVEHLYEPVIAAGGRLGGFESGRHWHDLGTPERYRAAALNWGLGRWPRRFWRSNWLAPGAAVDDGAAVRGSVVERGAVVEDGCRIDRSLILPGARIGAGSRLRRALVGPRVEVPEGSTIQQRMVTTARADVALRSGDSIVGGLVVSRLEGSR